MIDLRPQIALYRNIALLIDADNIYLSYIKQILDITKYYGEDRGCAYGDWTQEPLIGQKETLEKQNIYCVQVDRVGKNATDHHMLVEIGERLQSGYIELFILASGDGDFASACKLIQARGSQVVIISSKHKVSAELKDMCQKFHAVEDLSQELAELARQYPLFLDVPMDAMRKFSQYIVQAYAFFSRFRDNQLYYGYWVPRQHIENILNERLDFCEIFSQYDLATWIKLCELDLEFEINQHAIRRIDTNPNWTRCRLLLEAWSTIKKNMGKVYIGDIGKILRKILPPQDYVEYFGGKKLSKWLADYPNVFKIEEEKQVLVIKEHIAFMRQHYPEMAERLFPEFI